MLCVLNNYFEYALSNGLFIGILNRYQYSIDPKFAAQMRPLEIALENTIEQQTDPGY